MKLSKTTIGLAGLLVILALGSAASYLVSHRKQGKEPGKTLVSKTKKKPVFLQRNKKSKRILAGNGVQADSGKPNLIDLDAEEESSLAPEIRKLLEGLQTALDAEDGKSVSKIVEKLLVEARKNGTAVPPFVRAKAVEALGWFLPDSIADLMAFLADSDPDVLQDALDQFVDAIDDPSLGDRELSEIIKTCSRALTDDDALDAMFMAIETSMRNSVAIGTYKYIMDNGTDAAKAKVPTSIEDFTGEEGIKTKEDLDAWYADDNMDDEDDEDFYAGDREEEE